MVLEDKNKWTENLLLYGSPPSKLAKCQVFWCKKQDNCVKKCLIIGYIPYKNVLMRRKTAKYE